MAFWLLDGKIVVDNTGKPINCDTCPCAGCTPCCGCLTFSVILAIGETTEPVTFNAQAGNEQNDCCCEYDSGAVALPGGGTIQLTAVLLRDRLYWRVVVDSSPAYGTFFTGWVASATDYDDCCGELLAPCIPDTVTETCNEVNALVELTVSATPCDCPGGLRIEEVYDAYLADPPVGYDWNIAGCCSFIEETNNEVLEEFVNWPGFFGSGDCESAIWYHTPVTGILLNVTYDCTLTTNCGYQFQGTIELISGVWTLKIAGVGLAPYDCGDIWTGTWVGPTPLGVYTKTSGCAGPAFFTVVEN